MGARTFLGSFFSQWPIKFSCGHTHTQKKMNSKKKPLIQFEGCDRHSIITGPWVYKSFGPESTHIIELKVGDPACPRDRISARQISIPVRRPDDVPICAKCYRFHFFFFFDFLPLSIRAISSYSYPCYVLPDKHKRTVYAPMINSRRRCYNTPGHECPREKNREFDWLSD